MYFKFLSSLRMLDTPRDERNGGCQVIDMQSI